MKKHLSYDLRPVRRETIELYIEQRTIPEPNTGCLLWTAGADKDGYGKLMYEKRHRRAHVVVFELIHGPVPPGHLVMHRCDTPACCNHKHLLLGTPLSNMEDKVRKGRLRNQHMGKTHCHRGHSFNEINTKIYSGKRTCVQCRWDIRGVNKSNF